MVGSLMTAGCGAYTVDYGDGGGIGWWAAAVEELVEQVGEDRAEMAAQRLVVEDREGGDRWRSGSLIPDVIGRGILVFWDR